MHRFFYIIADPFHKNFDYGKLYYHFVKARRDGVLFDKDSWGRNALFWAIRGGYKAITKTLITIKSDLLDDVDIQGHKPLDYARDSNMAKIVEASRDKVKGVQ